jgi:hypothetical protein
MMVMAVMKVQHAHLHYRLAFKLQEVNHPISIKLANNEAKTTCSLTRDTLSRTLPH